MPSGECYHSGLNEKGRKKERYRKRGKYVYKKAKVNKKIATVKVFNKRQRKRECVCAGGSGSTREQERPDQLRCSQKVGRK